MVVGKGSAADRESKMLRLPRKILKMLSERLGIVRGKNVGNEWGVVGAEGIRIGLGRREVVEEDLSIEARSWKRRAYSRRADVG